MKEKASFLNSSFFKKKTLFRKLFLVTFLVAILPLIINGIYLLRGGIVSAPDEGREFFPIFYGFIPLAVILAAGGAFFLSHKIGKPISQFAKSATEIARGNFSHRVEVQSNDEIGRLAKIFNYMTMELQRLHEMNLNKIITEKNKTETIIKNIADGVIVTDPDNKILLLNSVAEKWFGLKENEVIERPIEQFIKDEKLHNLIKKVRLEGNNRDSSVEIKVKTTASWKESILQAKSARVIRDDGKLIGIVTIFRDITQEKEIDRMKTELVSMVAHELRSPLTSIAGFSELLLDSGLSKKRSHEYASIILKESNRLGELINKFLDISKIESGKSQIKKVRADLGEIIENVIDSNLYQAEKKGIRVTKILPPNLPPVFMDKEMMAEVILNLFSNAIKYSPENTQIEIRVKEESDRLTVEVSDQGYGIPEYALPRIFDKFYRVPDNEKVREVSGSGLGLSLVKEIVEIHEGTVAVKSKVGVGSTFSFFLPKQKNLDFEVKEERANELELQVLESI